MLLSVIQLYCRVLILCITMIQAIYASSPLPELPLELEALIEKQIQSLPKHQLDVHSIESIFADGDKDTLLRLVTVDKDRITMHGVLGTTQFNNYSLSIYSTLKRLNDQGLLPHTTMLFYFNDGVTEETYQHGLDQLDLDVPVFTFALDSKLPDANRYLLFPDGYTMKESDKKEVVYWHGWRRIYQEISDAITEYPWQNKKNIVFWRGRLTDCFFSKDCKKSARLSLVQDYKNNTQIDASFVTASMFDISPREQQYKNLYSRKFVQRKDQLLYKYLLNIDGSTCTYPGYLWRLYSNSVVLKQESSNMQWFYPLFKPYEHYVPVAYDLKDLEEKLDWLAENDTKAKQIADNGTQQVKKYLHPDLLDAYIVRLITRYTQRVKIIK